MNNETKNETPKVYIACLASYNSGELHGAWIDLDGSEDIEERINEILAESPVDDAEEWAVHDSEYCGNLSEHAGLDTLNAIKDAFEEVERCGHNWELYTQYCDYKGDEIEPETVEAFFRQFRGQGDTLEDWCKEFLRDCGDLNEAPKSLHYYFDFEKYARDLELGGDIYTIEHDGSVYVFWDH